MESPESPAANPFEGLYAFAQAHFPVINAVVFTSTAVVSLFYFPEPKSIQLPRPLCCLC